MIPVFIFRTALFSISTTPLPSVPTVNRQKEKRYTFFCFSEINLKKQTDLYSQPQNALEKNSIFANFVMSLSMIQILSGIESAAPPHFTDCLLGR